MLYSYITFPNDVLEKGIKAPVLLEEHQLVHYAQRAGTFKKEGIVEYLETVFKGRSRAISCLTEPVPDLKSLKIQGFKKLRDCFYFSQDLLNNTEIVQAVYVFDGDRIEQVQRLDFSKLAWESVRDDDDQFFKRIRHYMLVLNKGFLPPELIKKAS